MQSLGRNANYSVIPASRVFPPDEVDNNVPRVKEERITNLKRDPAVQDFGESHVTCRMCGCRITLKGKSYYIGPWRTHRRECVKKFAGKCVQTKLNLRPLRLTPFQGYYNAAQSWDLVVESIQWDVALCRSRRPSSILHWGWNAGSHLTPRSR